MKSNPLKIYLRYAKKRGWLKPMASNLQLTELEQQVLNCVREFPGVDRDWLQSYFMNDKYTEVDQALSNLISNSYVSADEDLRYSAAGGAL